MPISASPALRRPNGTARSLPSVRRRPWRTGKPLNRGLCAERELELARLIQQGDEKTRIQARNELVEGNLALVEFFVYRFSDRASASIDLDDLAQEGRLGLMRAAELYDPFTHGTRFTTFASYWVKQKLLRVIREQSDLIRIPEYRLRRGERLIPPIQSLGDEPAVDHPHPLDRWIEAEERRQFRSLLRGLSGAEALTIWRYLFHGREPMNAAVSAIVDRLRTQALTQDGSRGT